MPCVQSQIQKLAVLGISRNIGRGKLSCCVCGNQELMRQWRFLERMQRAKRVAKYSNLIVLLKADTSRTYPRLDSPIWSLFV
jgi:hypothetical protein